MPEWIVEVKQGEEVRLSRTHQHTGDAVQTFFEMCDTEMMGRTWVNSALMSAMCDRFAPRVSYHHEPFTYFAGGGRTITMRQATDRKEGQ